MRDILNRTFKEEKMMQDPKKVEVPGFVLVPSGGMTSAGYCTGCACDSEREEPFYLTFGNSWNLGWRQGQ